MKIHRVALACLVLGIAGPNLLAPRAAVAGVASTIEVNCAGVNADDSGCTWKLFGQISYTWTNGDEPNFNNLVPADLVEFGNHDLYCANVMDSNVKTMAANITGYWKLTYYSYPNTGNIVSPADYVIPAASIIAGETCPSTAEFSGAKDIQDAYLYVYSQETGESEYDSITESQL